MEGVDEALIPGVPDDLALRCLARLSHGFLGVVHCVSKRWRDVIRSRDYALCKKENDWCGDWLFISTDSSDNQWMAYDPEADRLHPLPRMLSSNHGQHFGFSCVSVCDRFLVIGGTYESACGDHLTVNTNRVFSFDPYRQLWSEVASMSTARTYFACSVICRKVYVAGGCNSGFFDWISLAEVYDPINDRWQDLPAKPNPMAACYGLSYNEKYYSLNEKLNISDQKTMEVFNIEDRCWSTVQDTWQWQQPGKYPLGIFVIDGRLYTVIKSENSVHARNTEAEDWYQVGSVPEVIIPDHPRLLKSFGYSLKKQLFVIGEKAKFEEHGGRRLIL